MDSGCSFHMTPNREWFETLELDEGSVLLGNNHLCEIKGRGGVRLRMDDGSVKILSDVRFIPGIKRNLVSLGLLELKGCCFMSKGGQMTVSKNSQVIMRAIRRSSLYYLMAETIIGQPNVAEKPDATLWHQRLGHIGNKGLMELGKRKLIQMENPETCEQCILGKSKKAPFPKGMHTSSSVLDYAHSDLWGPCQTVTLGGGKYFMSIIDDYSRKLWVFILKDKSEAFGMFEKWSKSVEVEKGHVLKCLRTDNGLEFLSGAFQDFCSKKGIKRPRTVPSNPQQNGVAERMNRTIMERVRYIRAGNF